jgi:hypothetical protein
MHGARGLCTTERGLMIRSEHNHFAPAALLFFLAPLFGEYLLGNLKFSEIVYVLFIAPLYGAGALLVREVVRRAGRGYATMLILGIAYALIEEGLVDQLLFNPAYFTGQEQLMNTVIPVLGLDAWLTLIVIAMHAVWSICIPIILVEAIFAKRGKAPWLGNIGLAVVAAIFVVGSVWLWHTISLETGFFASAPQLIGTAVVIAALIIAAFAFEHRMTAPAPGFVPNAWMTGAIAFAASSLYMLTEFLPGWTRVGACILIAAVCFTLIFRWSYRSNWSVLHTLALAGGGILTYAWLGAFMEPETGPKTIIDHIGTMFFIGGAIGLFITAAKKMRTSRLIESLGTFSDDFMAERNRPPAQPRDELFE